MLPTGRGWILLSIVPGSLTPLCANQFAVLPALTLLAPLAAARPKPLFLPSSVSRSCSVSPLASARPEGGLCSLVAQSLVPRSLAPQSAQAAGALRLTGTLPPSSVRKHGRASARAQVPRARYLIRPGSGWIILAI